MGGHDLLKSLAEPLRDALRATLLARALPLSTVTALVELFDAAAIALLAIILARGAAALLAAAGELSVTPWRRRTLNALFALSALAAAALLPWIVSHRTPNAHEMFARWDHLAFAALAGCALSRLPLESRKWVLVLLSLAFLAPYSGPLALGVVLGANLLAFVALGFPAARRTAPAVLVHGGLIVAVYALCWRIRPHAFFQAAHIYGLFSFLIFRQISVAAAIRAGERPRLSSYLCYLSFYPSNAGLLGGPEIYTDFARRNLGARTHHDYRSAATKIARGALQLWLADRLPVSFPILLATTTTPAVWATTLLLFVSTALKVMGFWAMIEASALLYGFRLQPNFTGIFTRTNPSELWWAWRGTFTNWLVRYVYGPLGANQRHQSLNIVAAFGVSWLWHVLGIPFLTLNVRASHVAPITFWAALNATALLGHVHWQRHGWTILPPRTPERLRHGIKIVLTCLLASFNVAPLLFQGDQIGRFWGYLRLLLGIGG